MPITYEKADYNCRWIPNQPMRPWKVYFNGNFWGHHGNEKAGREIPLHKQFIWDGEVWYIPAVYNCSKGVVVDFCVRIPAERIQSFMSRWNLVAG